MKGKVPEKIFGLKASEKISDWSKARSQIWPDHLMGGLVWVDGSGGGEGGGIGNPPSPHPNLLALSC